MDDKLTKDAQQEEHARRAELGERAMAILSARGRPDYRALLAHAERMVVLAREALASQLDSS